MNILSKINKKVLARKALISVLALGLGLIVIENQPLRKWTIEAITFAAPSINVLEFVLPSLTNQDVEN